MNIDKTVERLEPYVLHVPLLKRSELFDDIKKYLEEYAQSNPEKVQAKLKSIFKRPEDFLNFFLERHGQGTISPPFYRAFFKNAILIFLAMFFLFFLAGYIFYKSISPIVRIDENTGVLELFGGQISIEENQFNGSIGLFMKSGLIETKVDSVSVNVEKGSMKISYEDIENFKYNCKAVNPKNGANDLFTIDGKKLNLNFKYGKCSLTLPLKTKLDVDMESGSIVIENVDSPFVVNLEHGKVVWIGNKTNFSLDAKIKKGEVDGDPLQFRKDKGGISAKITIGNGNLSFQ